MCPKCRSTAPLVHHAMSAHCSACGAPVMRVQGAAPLLAPGASAASIAGAGTGHNIASITAYACSWAALLIGVPLTALVAWGASLVGDLIAWLSGLLGLAAPGGSWAVWVLAFLVGLPTLVTTFALRRASGWLEKQSARAKEVRSREVVQALAAARSGLVRPEEAALYLGTTVSEASTILARIASADPLGIDVDVSDDGDLRYRYKSFSPHEGDQVRTRIAALDPFETEPVAPATHAADDLDALDDLEDEPHAPRRRR